MSCNECRTDNQQEEKANALEIMNSANEAQRKRDFIIILVLIALLFATNLAWFIYESQYEEVSTSIEAEQETADGGNNYVVGGDMIGEATSKSDG